MGCPYKLLMSHSTMPQRGLYFEDIQENFAIASQGRTITEADLVAFGTLTGDFNPLHLDEQYARQTLFGGRIAHGMLGLAYAVGLAWQLGFMLGTVEAFRELAWQFRKPIMIGDTIHATLRLASKKSIRGYRGGLVTLDISLVNQKGEAVQKGTWTILVKGTPD